MMLYDIFSYTGGRPPGVPHHRHLSKRQVHARDPVALERRPRRRHHLLRRPGRRRPLRRHPRPHRGFYGAHVASRVKVEGFLKVGERVVGVKAHDLQTDEHFEIRAKQVVNATGVWTDDTQRMVGERGTFKVRASKGIHLVVPRDRIQSAMGMIFRTEKSVLFVIPWGRHWLIGTTDTDWNLDKAHPAATAADIDYLLEHVNAVLAVPLTREDVEGVFAGLRPLLAGESDQTSKLSREHIVAHTVPGLVVVAGGKWTTYRVMAKDAIDAAADALDGTVPPSTTAGHPAARRRGLPGRVEQARQDRAGVRRAQGADRAPAQPLRHDDRRAARPDPRRIPQLGEPLPGADDYLGAEVVYAASHEGALHLDDVLARRTRISIEAWDRGVSAAPVAAKLMGGVLGWDEAREELEVERYLQRVAAERASQEQPDDESADRVRLEAPDIVKVD